MVHVNPWNELDKETVVVYAVDKFNRMAGEFR